MKRMVVSMSNIFYSIQRYFVVFWRYLRLALQVRLAYRASFFAEFSINVLSAVSSLLFIEFLYANIPAVAGWSHDEALVILASYFIIQSISWLFLMSGMWRFDYMLRIGSFDRMLVRPMHPLALIGFSEIQPETVVDFSLALFLLGRYVFLYSFPPVWIIILYILFLFFGVVILLSFLVILRTINFKTINTWSISIFVQDISNFGRYPRQIFQGKLFRFLAATILPVVFMGAVPAEIFLGKVDWWYVVFGFLTAAVFFLSARFLWNRALKSYSSASS